MYYVRVRALQLRRIVDLLVKLEVEDAPDHTPLVTAGRFRQIAEQFYGLEKPPPDEWPV